MAFSPAGESAFTLLPMYFAGSATNFAWQPAEQKK
jgi:hypothetical protein